MSKGNWAALAGVILVVAGIVALAESCRVEANRPPAEQHAHVKVVGEDGSGRTLPWTVKSIHGHKRCVPDADNSTTTRKIILPQFSDRVGRFDAVYRKAGEWTSATTSTPYNATGPFGKWRKSACLRFPKTQPGYTFTIRSRWRESARPSEMRLPLASTVMTKANLRQRPNPYLRPLLRHALTISRNKSRVR